MEVTLYHQQSCPQCKMVEALLEKRNIAHKSNSDIDYMTSIGIKTTPTLSVDGTLLTGKAITDWIRQQ